MDDESNDTEKLIVPEKKWTNEAMSRYLDLIEDRKRNILISGSMESVHKLRYEEWHIISQQLQGEGFIYTTASCQKKYNNMRRSYIGTKKVVEKEKSTLSQEEETIKPIRVAWPYFKRFAEFLDEEVDPNIVIKIDNDEDDDEEDGEDKKSKKSVRNSKYRAHVSNVIHTLLKSEPVVILEDYITAEGAAEGFELQDATYPDTITPDEQWKDEDSSSRKESLIRKLRRRRAEASTYTPTTQSKRKRKSRKIYSPSRSSTEPDEVVSTPIQPPAPPKRKTFTLNSSSSSGDVVAEIKKLRGDVKEINHSLEDLVTSQNRLSDNFEKFFKMMSKRGNDAGNSGGGGRGMLNPTLTAS